jgi:HlyD family secretion protein
MKRLAVVGAIVAVVAGTIFYRNWAENNRPVEVSVAEVKRGSILVEFTADGIVRGRSVDLAPKILGRVEAIRVREGEIVQEGQTLLILDRRELEAAVVEARAAARVTLIAVNQAAIALQLSQQQADAREKSARAMVAAVQAQLQQLQAGARPQEIVQVEQQVKEAEAGMGGLRKTLERARQLHSMGALPKADLDEAEARYEGALAQYRASEQALALLKSGARPEEKAAAQARLEAARADLLLAQSMQQEINLRKADRQAALARLKQAEATLARAQTSLQDVVLRAPFDGIINRIPIEVGQILSPTQPAMTLVSRRNLWVEADISDEDVGKVKNGQEVFITAPGYPGRKFKGIVQELSPQAELKPDAVLRTRILRIRVKLLEGTQLLTPGLEVDVEGKNNLASGSLVLSSDALLFQDNQNVVFVVQEDRAEKRVIQTGYYTYALTEVISGLQEGEQVVIKGKDDLQDGKQVKVKN